MLANTLFFALSLAGAVAAGMYPKDGPVKMLTAKEFKKTLSQERSVMVAFVAPWCGHCKNLTPEFTKAAGALHPMVPFYAVDCDEQANKQLCAEQEVKGFPTVKSFPRGLKTPGHVYQGDRKAKEMVDWMSSEIPNKVSPLKGKEAIENWLDNMEPTLPHVLLITGKPRTPVMWKVLQNEFKKSMVFGAAKDADGNLAADYAVTAPGSSHILIWKQGAKKPEVYTGTPKLANLVEYLEGILEAGSAKQEL